MACDIHLYFERKNKAGVWEKIEFPEDLSPNDRNYRLFSYLVGVRNYENVEPWFADRGIPKDSSIFGNSKEYSEDNHSWSYAYLDEILRAPWKEVGLDTCYFYMFCGYCIPRLISFYGLLNDEEKRNIRIIIGFDN